MATLNRITGLVVGQYGSAVTLTVVDSDGVVIDLSGYTAATIKIKSPDALRILSFTGTLVGGGGSGGVSFTPDANNTFDREGVWTGQINFTATNVLAPTVPFEVVVSQKI